jgi:hypothetical protein
MTTKVFCDGCGGHIAEPHRVNQLHVSYPNSTRGPDQLDLCPSCMDSFRANHLPSKWTRIAPQTREPVEIAS